MHNKNYIFRKAKTTNNLGTGGVPVDKKKNGNPKGS
jgi:hypothetical protein